MSPSADGRAIRALAVVLTALVVASTLSSVVALAGVASASPSGFAGVPDGNVRADVPDYAQAKMPNASALEGRVMTNASASTTEVTITTEAAALGRASACKGQNTPDWCESPELALNISDAENHGARRVAIPKDVIVDAVGHVPETVYGRHESGDQWTDATDVEDGYVIFTIPHFSTNTVTFDGEYSLSMQPASNGDTVSYDLNTSEVSNFSIDITGVVNTESETESATDVGPTSTQSISVAGNKDPTGPSAGNKPEITVTNPGLSINGSLQDATNLGSAAGVDIAGDYLYVASGDSLQILDVSDPSNPSIVGSVTDSTALNTAKDVVVDGNYAYVSARDDDSVAVVDVSTPSSPTVATSITDTSISSPVGVDVDGSHLYVANINSDELTIVDISSPTSPSVAASPSSTDLTDAWDVVVDSGYAYVSGQVTDSLVAFDVSTPSSPSESGSVVSSSKLNKPWGLAVSGSYVYAGTDSGNVTAIDISTPSSPTIADTNGIASGASVRDVAVSGNYLYATTKNHVQIEAVDISTPSTLTVADTVTSDPESYYARWIATDGNNVYWSSPSNDLIATSPTAYQLTSVSVSDDATHSATLGDISPGESATAELTLSMSSTQLSWSASGGELEWSLSYTERTVSEDPTLTINGGNTTSYSGQLSDGTTTSLTTSTSWLDLSGPNTVSVTVSDSLGADAPTGQVDVSYSHDATDKRNISYASEQWTDRYNASKTFASDRTVAWFNISHESNVVAMRDVRVRINESGGWTNVASGNYYLTGNDLAVDLDAVYGETIPATTTMEIMTNASKVTTHNVTIEVLEATPADETLDSKIRVESIQSGAYIAVGPTDEGDRVHYTYSESWSDPDEYVIIDAAGNQELHIPGATSSSTMRVTHVPTKVSVQETTGDVKIHVASGGTSPELDISPGPQGSGDDIEVTYYSTKSGSEYLLYSLTKQIVRDTDVAQSPAIFKDDDSNELLEILLDGGGGSSSSNDSSGGVVGQFQQSTSGIPLPLLAIALLGALGLVYVGARRFTGSGSGSSSRSSSGGGLVSGLSSTVAGALTNPLTLGAIGAVVLVWLVISGAISLPPGGGILMLIAGIPLITYVSLRSIGQYSLVAFLVISLISVVVGLRLLGEAVFSQTLEALQPVLPIIVIGGGYLLYKYVQASRAPEKQTTLQFNIDDESGGGGD